MCIRDRPGKAKAAQEALCGGAFVLSCEKLTPEWPEQKEQPEGDSRASSPSFQESEFVDVRVDRLDELQYLSGELLVMMSSFSNELQLKGCLLYTSYKGKTFPGASGERMPEIWSACGLYRAGADRERIPG